MSRDEQERLRDIKDAIVAIRQHLAQTQKCPKFDHFPGAIHYHFATIMG